MWIRGRWNYSLSTFRRFGWFYFNNEKNSNIDIDQKIEAAELVLNSNIKKFIETHKTYSHVKLSRDMINNINNIKLDMKIDEKLDFCIDIVASFFPLLREEYEKFYQHSTGLRMGKYILDNL